jgi:hypothetical protein
MSHQYWSILHRGSGETFFYHISLVDLSVRFLSSYSWLFQAWIHPWRRDAWVAEWFSLHPCRVRRGIRVFWNTDTERWYDELHNLGRWTVLFWGEGFALASMTSVWFLIVRWNRRLTRLKTTVQWLMLKSYSLIHINLKIYAHIVPFVQMNLVIASYIMAGYRRSLWWCKGYRENGIQHTISAVKVMQVARPSLCIWTQAAKESNLPFSPKIVYTRCAHMSRLLNVTSAVCAMN